ncbi:amino acid permease 2 [Cordyceps fumosorosea ARSEF 2679]|uniref:Amino acid permease 2 n=1 Tax=Cordyceps fumosorosea (strain ARSEF 2679) TaxID=1081104 RepID=A0A167R3W5_CORFA|nr:amino acid permease 2 [Cordyceps fumosorosea ARSEF 2679]OAA58248.1 amino acid permease 2 [Cordyceps fumosorosea ARSEF 2679]
MISSTPPDRSDYPRSGTEKAKAFSSSRAAMDPELSPSQDTGAHHMSSPGDVDDMRRMGRSQELVRRFRLWSLISFVALATAAWELAIFGVSPALVDGGRAGMLWSSVWCFLGFGPVYLSMAEMASMAPTAGAQYHWVSEFAPERVQKTLSYFTGWSSTLAWQAGNAWGLILIGTLLQAIVKVNNEAYAESAPNWHGTVIVIGVSVLAVAANVFGARWLPYWQNAVFVLHILAYAGFIVPIWVNGPKVSSHSQVWGSWEDRGGWPSTGLSIMVGQLPALASQTAIDSAVHMAEEVCDASVSIPRVMLATWAFNYVTIFIALITISYHVPDIDLALDDATGYPVIFVLRASMSLPWLNVVLIVILLLLIFGNLSYLASVTRDLFAFARDQGLPFSSWISRVDPVRSIPTNACIVTGTTTALLSLVYIGSPVAFYAVISLSTVAILQCYCLILVRFVEIQIIPRSKFDEMDRVVEARRKSTIRRTSMPNDPQAMIEEEQAWRPIMIGNPIGKMRRMSILELGSMTRWQEIRKKNRLIDAGAHLNRGALGQGLGALDDQMSDLKRNLHIGSGRKKVRRMYRSDESSETGNDLDFDGYSMSNLSTPGRNRDDPMETAMIDEEIGRAQQK